MSHSRYPFLHWDIDFSTLSIYWLDQWGCILRPHMKKQTSAVLGGSSEFKSECDIATKCPGCQDVDCNPLCLFPLLMCEGAGFSWQHSDICSCFHTSGLCGLRRWMVALFLIEKTKAPYFQGCNQLAALPIQQHFGLYMWTFLHSKRSYLPVSTTSAWFTVGVFYIKPVLWWHAWGKMVEVQVLFS